MTKTTCSCGCGQLCDRDGQRYRRECHMKYMRAWRAGRAKKVPAPAPADVRYQESRERLQLELEAFNSEGR